MMRDKTYFLVFLIGCVILILGIIITIIILLSEDKEEEEEKEDWNQYDSYIFSMFWPPSSCFNKYVDNKTCFNKVRELNNDYNFIIHGLWPTYISGNQTSTCNKRDEINITFNDEKYKSELSELWPGLYSSDQYMWNHEYNKHGYCYIRRIEKNTLTDYKIYFDKARELFGNYRLLMEAILPDTDAGLHIITKNKFKMFLSDSDFKINPSTYSLICTKNNTRNLDVLYEIRFNYGLDFKFIDNIKSSENCPENFYLYFSDENRLPVYKKFEFYVFTLLWNPSSCKQIGKECYRKLKERELNILMIHGLWPSYKSGKFPQWCNLGEDIPVRDFEGKLKVKMDKYWIGTYSIDNIFRSHEYNKHGYCYNQLMNESESNYSIYFQKGIDLYYKFEVKNLLKDLFPKILPGERKLNKTAMVEKLDLKFGVGRHTMTCFEHEGRFLLYEIRLKLDLEFNLTTDGITINNCPEIIYAEFMEEEEGPQKQAEGFYDTYDMYFFTILWLGTTCHMKGEYCYENIEIVPKNIFTMHGLWPNYRNGTLADWCNGKNDIEIEIHNETLSEFMNTHYVSGYHTNAYFWGHEYNKHGYCYNQRNNISVTDYETYFDLAREMYLKYDFANIFLDMYKDRIEKGDMIINRKELENYLANKGFNRDTYVVVCTNINETEINPHLLEIRIRFDLEFNLLPNATDKSEFDCPDLFYAQFL